MDRRKELRPPLPSTCVLTFVRTCVDVTEGSPCWKSMWTVVSQSVGPCLRKGARVSPVPTHVGAAYIRVGAYLFM